MADDTTKQPTTEHVPITRRQADILRTLDARVEAARRRVEAAVREADAAVLAVLAGTDVRGDVVAYDADEDPPVLVVEVAPDDEGEGGA